jgi:hypothetical protein
MRSYNENLLALGLSTCLEENELSEHNNVYSSINSLKYIRYHANTVRKCGYTPHKYCLVLTAHSRTRLILTK